MAKTVKQRSDYLKKTYSEQCLGLILSGYTESRVKSELLEMCFGDKVTQLEVHEIYIYSKNKLTSEYSKERDLVIATHIGRYNKEIKRLFTIDVSEYNKWKAQEMKTYAYFNLLEVLVQKERVLGLHSKQLHVKINNELNAKVTKSTPKLLLDGLTLEEKIELYHLLEEAKIDEENISIIPSTKKKEVKEVVEDVEFEEVPDNITYIKKKELGVYKQEDGPKTLMSIQEKLKQNLQKQFNEKLKESKK